MKILDHRQILRKIKRLALEILESHIDSKIVYVGGINNNGMRFAELILKELRALSDIEWRLFQINLNPALPTQDQVQYDTELKDLKRAQVIIVDDVGNTGRTLFYACQPLTHIIPKTVSCAVLVDRKHKSFPIAVKYVGLSLATTLKENIDVRLADEKNYEAYLV